MYRIGKNLETLLQNFIQLFQIHLLIAKVKKLNKKLE